MLFLICQLLNILISFITTSKSIRILSISSDDDEANSNKTTTNIVSNDIFETSNHSVYKDVKKFNTSVFYLSTPEGISSRYKQLEELWRFTTAVNKSIILPSTFMYKHYGEKVVNLCEVFQLPRNIFCSNRTFQAITNSTECVLTDGINHVSPEFYTLSNATVRQQHVDFLETRCIAGYIGNNLSIIRLNTGFPKHEMHRKYLNLLPTLRNTLGVNKPKLDYAVFHWRRGDQLTSRCTISVANSVITDHSVNCDTVWDFIRLVKANLKEYCTIQTIVYVATNEVHNASLSALKRHGYKLFEDIVPSISSMIDINALSAYAIELAMTAYFFAWGKSTAHQFIEQCRDATKKKHIKLTYTNKVVFERPK